MMSKLKYISMDDLETKNEYICHLCFPDAEEIGEVLPGLYLGKKDGKYFLIWEPCHLEQECYEFESGVEPRPDPNHTDEEIEADKALFEEDMAWVEETQKNVTLQVGLHDAQFWVEAMEKDGYVRKEHGDARMYLYDKCGKAIEAWKTKNEEGSDEPDTEH